MKILNLNLFFYPESIGGATVVAAIDPRSARVRRSLPSCPARAYTRR